MRNLLAQSEVFAVARKDRHHRHSPKPHRYHVDKCNSSEARIMVLIWPLTILGSACLSAQ
jgi:hypothetical protein